MKTSRDKDGKPVNVKIGLISDKFSDKVEWKKWQENGERGKYFENIVYDWAQCSYICFHFFFSYSN